MKYNYSPLFDTLKQKGLSRKQLREALQLSTATMARMSAGEPIAIETLGRICDLLQCSLDKIFTISPKLEPSFQWSSIDYTNSDGKPHTFRIYMYFMLPTDKNDPALYLYGYAKPFVVNETDMEIWYITCDEDMPKQFCVVDGTLYANDLRRFLDAAMNRNTIGDIFRLLNIKPEPVKNYKKQIIKAEYLETILNARIANGRFVYRPPFLLPPENSCIEHTAELMPLISYEEETTICESLHGTNKRDYYHSDTGINATKAKLIWTYLAKMLPFHKNLNEMARLGNFEVLTYPDEMQCQPVKCEIWRDNEIQKGAKITVNKQLSGSYIVRVKLLNGRNPILDNSYIINPQNEEENPVYILLTEDFFFAELELWNAFPTIQTGQRLIYQSYTPYMRQISVNMSVLERSLILEDRWSQAMKRQGKKVNTDITLFSTESDSPLIGWQEEPWLIEERSIQCDYHRLFGDGKPLHDHDAFFPKGTDKTIEFLSWLNELMRLLPKTKRVLLFDPYINDTAIVKFIHSINSINVTYEIYTDSCPAGNKSKRKEEINAIKKLSLNLANIIASCNLTVRTLTREAGTLHDRVLMIIDNEQVIVYVFSNSLDTMAKNHSSIITAVKPAIAQDIFYDYVQLVIEAEKNHLIETIFNTKDIKSDVTSPSTAITSALQNTGNDSSKRTTDGAKTLSTAHIENNDKTYSKDDFIRDYSKLETEPALNQLAYMLYDEKLACINYILSLNKDEEIEKMQSILLKQKSEPVPVLNQEMGIYILNLNQMTRIPFDHAGNLIEQTSNLIGWSFCLRSVLPYTYHYAVKILWLLSPEKYVAFLEKLLKEFSDKIPLATTTLTSNSLLIYTMLAHILKTSSYKNVPYNTMFYFAKSNNAFLRAICAVKWTWMSESFLRNLILDNETNIKTLNNDIQNKCHTICISFEAEEASTTLVLLIKKLQIEICRHESVRKQAQDLINQIIDYYIQILPKHKKTDANYLIQQLAPLNMRNPADICQIVNKLRYSKHLTYDESYEILICFWKKIYSQKYYNEETIQRSLLIAGHIMQISTTATDKVLKEIAKRSRTLCTKLYDPLLYSKNYTVWKSTVDHLACLFITERHIASQNDAYTMSKGEAEYQKLTQNYDEILTESSNVYKIWKNNRLL